MSTLNERYTAMDILTRPEFNPLFKMISSVPEVASYLNELVAPMVLNQSVSFYSEFVSKISVAMQLCGAGILKKTFEKMDTAFRYSPGRAERYYVKNTRNRTIITIFGEVTYRRTEYIDRSTGIPFVYVDEEIGLFRRQRYDSTIAALAYDAYSHHTSMIEVGKQIGDRIAGFRLDPDRGKYAISRQQIFNMINRFSSIKTAPPKADETPETLYIMADEKYIHLQQEMKEWRAGLLREGYSLKDVGQMEKGKHFSEMVKLAVLFTGRKKLLNKSGEPLKRPRWTLTGTHYMAFPHDTKDFWSQVYDEVSSIYDMGKVKRIYILGDGAEWIRAGVNEMTSENCKVKFALDRYHLSKKINTITKEKAYRKLLTDYARNGDLTSFQATVSSLFSGKDMPDKTQEAVDYVLKHIEAAVVMNNEVKVGCGMEQAISHVLAAPFTAIPKAYVSDHLHTYVQARILYKNSLDPVRIYLRACDTVKDIGKLNDPLEQVDLARESLDFSMFDTKKSMPYHHANLDSVMKKRF